MFTFVSLSLIQKKKNEEVLHPKVSNDNCAEERQKKNEKSITCACWIKEV